MHAATIISAVSFLFIIASAIIVPFRVRFLRKKLGARECAFPRKSPFQFVGLLFFSPFFLAVPFCRTFSLPVIIAVSLVGCVLFVLSLHDIVFSRSGGIYERGLVWNGIIFAFSSIVAWDRPDPYTLRLRAGKKRRRVFSSADPDLVTRVSRRVEKSGYPLQ